MNVYWPEHEAFMHFLVEFGRQWLELSGPNDSAWDRLFAVRSYFDTVRRLVAELEQAGFRLGTYGFGASLLDATSGALEAFAQDRETDLKRLSG